jgi:hypothetical protein
MQKARHQAGSCEHGPLTACRRVVSGSLSSPFGVLHIFRSRYWFAIGRQGVLSLGRWASRIRTHFHVLGLTQVPDGRFRQVLRGFHPLGPHIPETFGPSSSSLCPVLQPRPEIPGGLGWSAFARRY